MNKHKKPVKPIQLVAKKQQEQPQPKYPLHRLIDAKSAGRKAFLLMIDASSNPYSGDLRAAWKEGHQAESLRHPFNERGAYGDRKPEKPYLTPRQRYEERQRQQSAQGRRA